ncbi:MAG: hypothetical protein HWE39_10875 [Oceanospirillaceae bacterium]|nr:hypothetical protein [Oceanospirillaceae bacterium]
MDSKKLTIAIGSALTVLFGSSLAMAHPTGTTSTVNLLTPAGVGEVVDITGKVETTGQGQGQNHPAVDPGQPVTSGTLQIQVCVDNGQDAPTAQCDDPEATGTWTLCSTAPSPCAAPANGAPDANGELTTTFDTSGLAGQVIGFRTQYVTPGGAHMPGTSNSEGTDLTIQGIDVLEVAVDIKPGSCPNPLNVNAKGVLPVAILGSDTLDVADIDPETVTLEGIPALRSGFEDVGAPFYPLTGKDDALDCNEELPDGYTDLTVKFNLPAVVTAALQDSADGDVIVMMVTGKLLDGTDFVGEDIVQILKKK